MTNIREAAHAFLLEHAAEMTNEWLEGRKLEPGSIYSANSSSEITNELREQNQKFTKTIADSLLGETDYKVWAEEVAESRVKQGVPLSNFTQNFRKFRQIFQRQLFKFAQSQSISVQCEEMWDMIVHFNDAFDHMLELFIQIYNQVHNEVLLNQQEVILELSTPVIPLADKVGVLPIVGTIDDRRALVIKEKCLEKCIEFELQHLVIDLSGVLAIDTMVANELFKIIQALSLLGVETILTGIRPEIAQVAVGLGLDFTELRTYAHLKQALSDLL